MNAYRLVSPENSIIQAEPFGIRLAACSHCSVASTILMNDGHFAARGIEIRNDLTVGATGFATSSSETLTQMYCIWVYLSVKFARLQPFIEIARVEGLTNSSRLNPGFRSGDLSHASSI